MSYVIIDLEFNNLNSITKYYPKFYEEHSSLKNIDFDNEIIEIGAIKLDKYMNEVDRLKTYIKPTIFAYLNPKITEITNITDSMLECGDSFEEAMDKLRNFADSSDILCSWAKDDVAELIKNAKFHNYDVKSWLNNYLDIQEYCTDMMAKKKVLSLRNALDELKISIESDKLHDALYDCICTAKVFKRLYNARSIKKYIINDVYNAPIFAAKKLEKRKIDKDRIVYTCPHCDGKLSILHDFKLFKWRFISLCECKRCRSKILKEVTIKESLKGEQLYNEIDTILDNFQYLSYNYKFEKSSKNDKM